jgi:flagellar protein FliS
MRRRGAAVAYKKIGEESLVEAADPHELVSVLFRELLSSLNAAEDNYKAGDLLAMRNKITKASRILTGLQGGLDFDKGGEIAGNLAELYGYCIRKLLASNSGGNVDGVEETRRLVIPLAEAWNLIK